MNEHNPVLYRKYRPKEFNEVVGQRHVVRVLMNALRRGKVAHAYVFSGPRGVGKTSIARILAKAVNCAHAPNGSGDSDAALSIPCGSCGSCTAFASNSSLNLIEIDAASNRGINEVRELRESVRFMPPTGKYKTYIIDESHQLTKEAFNALLKPLEEPPEHAIFILATTELEKLPQTIVSRTQQFDFSRPGIKDIKMRLGKICELEGAVCEDAALESISLAADGSLRDGESILGRILAVESKNVTSKMVEEILGLPKKESLRAFFSAIAKGECASSLAVLEEMIHGGQDIRSIARSALGMSRNAFLLKSDPGLERVLLEEATSDDIDYLKSLLPLFSPGRLQDAIRIFLEAGNTIRKSPIPSLPLEIAVVELTRDQSSGAVR